MARKISQARQDAASQDNAPSAQSAPQGEGQGTPLPALTVRVYLNHSPESKLRATASVSIAGVFAVRGFRIFDSKNGLFVKEPEQSYIKDGTEMSRSVFFPITREAREALYGQILRSYEVTMEKKQAQRPDWLLEGNDSPPQDVPPQQPYAPAQPQYNPAPEECLPPMQELDAPDDDLPFDMGMSY